MEFAALPSQYSELRTTLIETEDKEGIETPRFSAVITQNRKSKLNLSSNQRRPSLFYLRPCSSVCDDPPFVILRVSWYVLWKRVPLFLVMADHYSRLTAIPLIFRSA